MHIKDKTNINDIILEQIEIKQSKSDIYLCETTDELFSTKYDYYYTTKYPSIFRNNHDEPFIPKDKDFKLLNREIFYIALSKSKNISWGVHYSIASYIKENNLDRIPFIIMFVDQFQLYQKWTKYVKGCKILNISPNHCKSYIDPESGEKYYRLYRNNNDAILPEVIQSNEPWKDRQKHYYTYYNIIYLLTFFSRYTDYSLFKRRIVQQLKIFRTKVETYGNERTIKTPREILGKIYVDFINLWNKYLDNNISKCHDTKIIRHFFKYEFGKMCWIFDRAKNKEIDDEEFPFINSIYNTLILTQKLEPDMLSTICRSIILVFIWYLKDLKIINICPKCNCTFKYKKGKIYCNESCRRKAANKRDYNRHSSIRKQNMQKEMRLTRETFRRVNNKNK